MCEELISSSWEKNHMENFDYTISISQLGEQLTLNQWVLGSSPRWRIKKYRNECCGIFLCAIPSGAASRIAYGSRSARGDRSLKTLRRSVFFTRPLMAHHAERLAEKQGVFLLCCLTRRQDPVRHRGREQLVPAV